MPTPRTTTRGDVRVSSTPGSTSTPAPLPTPSTGPSTGRSAPNPVGGAVRPVGGSVAQPGTTAPVEPNTAAPTPRDIYDRRPRATPGTRPSAPIDQRYKPTRTTVPADMKPSVLKPRAVDPSANRPAVSDRYPSRRPGDVVKPNASSTPNSVHKAPRTNPRSVPLAPRLAPRTSTPVRTGVGSGWYRGNLASGVSGRYYGGVRDPWGCYWDPYYSYGYGHHHGYTYGSYCGWPVHCGYGSFGCSLSLWWPWWYCSSLYWGIGYSDCWWDTWSSPGCVSSSYWWYPSSVYCPTYLYVPSRVVVEEPAPEPAPALLVAAPAAAPAPVDARTLSAVDLAKKYVELGDFYFKEGRYAEAGDAYARARSYAPDDASVHFVLADAAFATGDYHFAAFLIAEALRLDPSMASAETDKRLYYGDVKEFEAQMKSLDTYLVGKPYDAQAHLVRGYNLRFSGQPAAAVEAFRRVLEIAPDNTAAATFLAALAPAPVAAPTAR